MKSLGQAGMSLIEILVALTLLGLAGTFIVGQVFDQQQQAEVDSAKILIRGLGDRLREFRRDCGSYPTTEQGLEALTTKPEGGTRECKRYPPNGYIDGGKIPKDPWDGEFVYESDGKTYTIISYGNDGVEGGEGADGDVSSKDL